MTLQSRRSRPIHPRIEPLEGRALLTAGGLDATFGSAGQVVTSPGNVEFLPQGLAVQSDLKTVVVGFQSASQNYPFNTSIVRYNANGSLDTSFGNGGVVSVATYSALQVNKLHDASVAIQADGKLVIATNTTSYIYTPATKKQPASYTRTGESMAVVRLNANGSLDSTFGQGGTAVIPIPHASFLSTGGVAVLADGSIVVAGSNFAQTAGPELLVARLTPSGALDSTFGPQGQGYNDVSVAPASSSRFDSADAFGVDAAGNLLVGGITGDSSTSTSFFQVARYTPNGLLDASFANQGVFSLAGRYAQRGVDGIGFQPDGHIILGLAVTPTVPKPAVLRLDQSGSVDTTFGSGGYYVENAAGTPFDAIAVQPDGKVLLEVMAQSSPARIQVDRLTPGGTLDPAFGTGGIMAFSASSPSIGNPKALAVGPDGKITGLIQADTAGHLPEIGAFRLLNDIASNAAENLVPPVTQSSIVLVAQAPDSDDSSRKRH